MSRRVVAIGLSLALVANLGEAATGQSDSIGNHRLIRQADAQPADVIELGAYPRPKPIHSDCSGTGGLTPSSSVRFDVVFRIPMN